MNNKKITPKILKIMQDYQKKMNRICNNKKDGGISSISIKFSDEPEIIIARRKEDLK